MIISSKLKKGFSQIINFNGEAYDITPVSYTHLDVYKRQLSRCDKEIRLYYSVCIYSCCHTFESVV